MNNLIARKTYLDKVLPFIGKQIIKVFTGQRRVGKSYILQLIMEYIRTQDKTANLIYINKEDLNFDIIKDANDLNTYVQAQTKRGVVNYVFIDEIQEIREFEKALRSLLLSPDYDLYCTGSNAYMLSGEISTFLSGRYIEIPVYSLSYIEFIQFHQLENNDDTLLLFMKYGGLPYLRNLELTDEIVSGYLKGIYNTVIYRDVISRNDIRNIAFLENLTTFLASNIGHLFSARKISDYLKSQKINMNIAQIIAYIDHLSNAMLINRVKRFDISGKKLFEIGEKFYFQDIGLRNTIFPFKQDDIGKIIENMVYNHLRFMGYEVNIGKQGEYEIDFVAKQNDHIHYFQVCYLLSETSTIEREFGNLERIKDNYPKTVISMDKLPQSNRNGIEHIFLRDFLMQENQ